LKVYLRNLGNEVQDDVLKQIRVGVNDVNEPTFDYEGSPPGMGGAL